MNRDLLGFSRSLLRFAGNAKARSTLERILKRLINGLHSGTIDMYDFVDTGTQAIDAEIHRQIIKAAKDLGLDVSLRGGGISAPWAAEMVVEQTGYLYKLAEEIIAARIAGNPVDPFLERVPMWGQISDNAYHRALVELGSTTTLLRWRMGPTIEHCETCLALDGVVANALDWKISGFVPQGRMLECKGFYCLCEWEVLSKEEAKALLATGWVSEVPVA